MSSAFRRNKTAAKVGVPPVPAVGSYFPVFNQESLLDFFCQGNSPYRPSFHSASEFSHLLLLPATSGDPVQGESFFHVKSSTPWKFSTAHVPDEVVATLPPDIFDEYSVRVKSPGYLGPHCPDPFANRGNCFFQAYHLLREGKFASTSTISHTRSTLDNCSKVLLTADGKNFSPFDLLPQEFPPLSITSSNLTGHSDSLPFPTIYQMFMYSITQNQPICILASVFTSIGETSNWKRNLIAYCCYPGHAQLSHFVFFHYARNHITPIFLNTKIKKLDPCNAISARPPSPKVDVIRKEKEVELILHSDNYSSDEDSFKNPTPLDLKLAEKDAVPDNWYDELPEEFLDCSESSSDEINPNHSTPVPLCESSTNYPSIPSTSFEFVPVVHAPVKHYLTSYQYNGTLSTRHGHWPTSAHLVKNGTAMVAPTKETFASMHNFPLYINTTFDEHHQLVMMNTNKDCGVMHKSVYNFYLTHYLWISAMDNQPEPFFVGCDDRSCGACLTCSHAPMLASVNTVLDRLEETISPERYKFAPLDDDELCVVDCVRSIRKGRIPSAYNPMDALHKYLFITRLIRKYGTLLESGRVIPKLESLNRARVSLSIVDLPLTTSELRDYEELYLERKLANFLAFPRASFLSFSLAIKGEFFYAKLKFEDVTNSIADLCKYWISDLYECMLFVGSDIYIKGLFHTAAAYGYCLDYLYSLRSRAFVSLQDFLSLLGLDPDRTVPSDTSSPSDNEEDVLSGIFQANPNLTDMQDIVQDLIETKSRVKSSCTERIAKNTSDLIVRTYANIIRAIRETIGGVVESHIRDRLTSYYTSFKDALDHIKTKTGVDLIKIAQYVLLFKLCYDQRHSPITVGAILAFNGGMICSDIVHLVYKIYRYFFDDKQEVDYSIKQESGYSLSDAFCDSFKILTGFTLPMKIVSKCTNHLKLFITTVAAGKGIYVLLLAMFDLVASPISYLINTYKFYNDPCTEYLRGNIRDAYKLIDVEITTPDQAYSISLVYSQLMAYTALYRLEKEKNYATKAASEAANLLRPKYLQALNMLSAPQHATQPIAIYLEGPAGCGKSTVVPKIMDYMWSGFHDSLTYSQEHRYQSRIRPANEVVCMTNDEYNDSYQPATFCVYDDPINSTDTKLNTAMVGAFINMINTSPYPLKVATPELKGKLFMRSKVLIVSSNLKLANGIFNLNSMDAVYRRFVINARMGFRDALHLTDRIFTIGAQSSHTNHEFNTIATLSEKEFLNYCYVVAKFHTELLSSEVESHSTLNGYRAFDFNDEERKYLSIYYSANSAFVRFQRPSEFFPLRYDVNDVLTPFPCNAALVHNETARPVIKDVFNPEKAADAFNISGLKFEGLLAKKSLWDRITFNLSPVEPHVLWYAILCSAGCIGGILLFKNLFRSDYNEYQKLKQESPTTGYHQEDSGDSSVYTSDTLSEARRCMGNKLAWETLSQSSRASAHSDSSYNSNNHGAYSRSDMSEESLTLSNIENKVKQNSVVVYLEGVARSPDRQWLFVNDHNLLFAAHEIMCIDQCNSITIGDKNYPISACKYLTLANLAPGATDTYLGQHFGILTLPRPHPNITNIISAFLPDENHRVSDCFRTHLHRYRPNMKGVVECEPIHEVVDGTAYDSQGLRATIHSGVGYCGAVYYSTIPNHNGNYIYGIHTHGSGSMSFATKVTARGIIATLDTIAKRGNNLKHPFIPPSLGVYGGSPAVVQHPTNIIPSKLYNALTDSPSKVPTQNNSPVVHRNSLGVVDTNISLVDEGILNECVTELILRNPYRKAGTLSLHEAINGVPGTIDSMDLSTSTGDCLGIKGKKADLFDGPTNFKRLKPEIQSAFDSYVADPTSFNWQGALKEETRSLTKIQAGLSRLFFVGPFFLVLLGRMILTLLQKEFSSHCVTGTISIGINPFNTGQWTVLANRFHKNKVLAGDKKSFDMHIPVAFLYAAARFMKHYLHDDAHYYVDFYLSELLLGTHVVNGVKYYKLGGNCSGGPSTAFFNSIINALMNLYCVKLCLPSDASFQPVDMVTYGDDDIIGVPVEYEDFLTYPRLQNAFKSIGVTYTSFDKSSTMISKHNALEEIQYLKRWFAADARRMYKAPRSLSDIYQQINFMKKDSVGQMGVETYHYQITQAVVVELTQHSEKVYKETLDILQQKLHALFGSRWTYPMYKDAISMYCSDVSLTYDLVASKLSSQLDKLINPNQDSVEDNAFVQESIIPSICNDFQQESDTGTRESSSPNEATQLIDYIPVPTGLCYPTDVNILASLSHQIGSFEYTAGSANLLYLSRLGDVIKTHPIATYLGNYAGWHSRFKIIFKISSSPMVGGFLLASFLPEINITNSSVASHLAAACYNSNQRVISTSEAEVEFDLDVTLPFDRHWPTYSTDGIAYGTFMVHTITPLAGSITGSEKVKVTMYLKLYDTVFGYRFVQESDTGVDTKVLDHEATQKSSTGVASLLIKSVGNVLDQLPFGPAKVIGSLSKPVGSLLEYFGFQMPLDQSVATSAIPTTSYGLSNTRGLFVAQNFSLSQATTQATNPELLHTRTYHTLHSLAQIPGYMTSFSFSSVSSGRIWERSLSQEWLRYQSGEYYYPTPFQTVLSNAHRYYTDLNMELFFACSPMVSAEILIVHTCTFASTTDLSKLPENAVSRLYKIEGNTRIKIRLPWVGPNSRSFIFEGPGNNNGYLAIYLITPPVTTSSTVDPGVHCSVFVAAADNLIMSMQNKSWLDGLWVQESDTNMHTTFANSSNFEYLQPVPPQVGAIIEGEALESLNDVLLRFSEPNLLPFTGSATALSVSHTLLRMFSRHRHGFRGVIYSTDASSSVKALTTSVDGYLPSGFILWHPTVSPTLSLSILRQSSKVYDVVTPWSSTSNSPPSVMKLLFSPTAGAIAGSFTISDDSTFANTIFPGRYKTT